MPSREPPREEAPRALAEGLPSGALAGCNLCKEKK